MAQAVEFYKKSLKLNPFLWWSFESICNTGLIYNRIRFLFLQFLHLKFFSSNLGERVDPSKYFTLNSAISAYKSQIIEPIINSNPNSLSIALQSHILQQENQNVSYNTNQSNVKNLEQQQQSSLQPSASDSFEQKGKQEIANILKEVETDQINKLNTLGQKSQQINSSEALPQPHYHHHASCVYYQNYIANLNANNTSVVRLILY
jgi:hypothetical protein